MKFASVVLSLVVAVVALVAVESASAQQGYGYQFGYGGNSYQPTYRQPCQPGMPGCQAGCHHCPPGMNCPQGMNGAPGMNYQAQYGMNPGYPMPRHYSYNPGMQPMQPQYRMGLTQPSYGQGFGPGFTR